MIRLLRPLSLVAVMAAALGLAALAVPTDAVACGGFFCSTVPVEQNAERILFELDPTANGGVGQVTAVVEVTYAGDADDFSWVIPVPSLPENPELDVAPGSIMTLFESATVPQIIPPPVICTSPGAFPPARGAGGLANESDASFGDDDDGVDVVDLPQVGPYAPQRITSDDPQALIEWLRENGYIITEAMEPIVEDYVKQDFDFLGMKLAPEAGVAQIQPIVIRYPGQEPMVPLALTSVASEPEMAVLVFIASDTRWESGNFANLQVDVEDVQWDPRTVTNNYYPLLSWMIDQNDGRAFITEYAGPTSEIITDNIFIQDEDAEEAYQFARDVLGRNTVLTRLYTRVSGWEMLFDPSFTRSAGAAVPRTIDLSDRPEVELCSTAAQNAVPVPCGRTYCGVGAVCATTVDGIDGCVCTADQSARTIQAPAGPGQALVDTVTCQPTSFDLLAEVIGTENGPADPCFANICGEDGSCVAVNGFPSCQCSEGFAAIPNGVGGTTCSEVVETFDADQVLWPTAGCASSCDLQGDRRIGIGAAAAFLLLLLPIAIRRRRA
jgi:hypothetical protein